MSSNPTGTKSAAKTTPKVAKQSAVKPAATMTAWQAAPQGQAPSLRFFHSQALRTRTHAVLSAIEAKPEAPGHAEALADVVNDLIDAGMDYYFLRALKQAEVVFVAEQSARLGLSGAVRLLSSVSRKFIVRMGPQQLVVVAGHIRTLA